MNRFHKFSSFAVFAICSIVAQNGGKRKGKNFPKVENTGKNGGEIPKNGRCGKFFRAFCVRALVQEEKLCYNSFMKMQNEEKLLTDVHTHSRFSHDGVDALADMLVAAYGKGLAFYGVSEHFDYDLREEVKGEYDIDAEAYFCAARRLQAEYAGRMNVLVGAEFGYSDDENVWGRYASVCEKYRPDFVVNSIHSLNGRDYYSRLPFHDEKGETLPKDEVYRRYIRLVSDSLDVPYPYDIVGHFGYLMRYAPYAARQMRYAEFADEIDEMLRKMIDKGKILEVNSSAKGLEELTLPYGDVIKRYFELGGRKVSFASDAHGVERVAHHRAEVIKILKEIGFTYVTVPCKGEHIKVEI